MISGSNAATVALAVALALGPLPARAERDITAPQWNLPELMARLRQVPSGRAHFVERKTLQMMTAPLQSSGTLRYTAPDRLEKQTLLPLPGRLTIAGDQVTMARDGEPSRTISLRETPEIGALVAGLRATMAGDAATLERFYTLVLRGDATAWQLDLVPRDERMRALVSAVHITGQGAALTGVVTEEADGDRTETIITPDPS